MSEEKYPYSTDKIKKILPEKLKNFRKNSGLTTNEVGKLLNKTASAVTLWEKGKAMPDVETLLKLCKIYNIDDINAFLTYNMSLNPNSLSRPENELIFLWRKAKPPIRAAIKTILKEAVK